MAETGSYEHLTRIIPGLFDLLTQVKAICLSGSRTSSASDQKSDIDFYVYTTGEIPLESR